MSLYDKSAWKHGRLETSISPLRMCSSVIIISLRCFMDGMGIGLFFFRQTYKKINTEKKVHDNKSSLTNKMTVQSCVIENNKNEFLHFIFQFPATNRTEKDLASRMASTTPATTTKSQCSQSWFNRNPTSLEKTKTNKQTQETTT